MAVTCDDVVSTVHTYFRDSTFGLPSGDDYPYSIGSFGARVNAYTTETLDVSVSDYTLNV